MRSNLLGALALILFGQSSAHAGSASEAFAEDKVCMVRHAYTASTAPSASEPLLDAATRACITFEAGSGAWYAARRAKTAAGFDAEGAYEGRQLAVLRKTARVYLAQALSVCAGLDEAACLTRVSTPGSRPR